MILGIDLGTTNSLVAHVAEGGTPRAIPNVLGQALTPSVVSVDEDGVVLVGQSARERLMTHPGARPPPSSASWARARPCSWASAASVRRSCPRWCCARSRPMRRRRSAPRCRT